MTPKNETETVEERRAKAGNPSTPLDVLAKLATDDEDAYVRRYAAKNASTPRGKRYHCGDERNHCGDAEGKALCKDWRAGDSYDYKEFFSKHPGLQEICPKCLELSRPAVPAMLRDSGVTNATYEEAHTPCSSCGAHLSIHKLQKTPSYSVAEGLTRAETFICPPKVGRGHVLGKTLHEARMCNRHPVEASQVCDHCVPCSITHCETLRGEYTVLTARGVGISAPGYVPPKPAPVVHCDDPSGEDVGVPVKEDA